MSSDKSLVALFNEALDREDPVERMRFLEEACGTDAMLRERVEKLLRAHEEAEGFFSQPSRTPAPGQSSGLTEKVGDRIGRYKLLQWIGEGGCGVVYLAEQEEPMRRRVALKLIKLGMDTRQVVARFEAERQALALMDHPNIAKVLDGGATDTGRPYFVMEMVRGTKITQFCDQKKLAPRERLELFLQVCQAIQHAHQKAIIHRDIKPSNILVPTIDGHPVPKVIDFGIAKATNNQRLTDLTLFTAFEQFIGTPAYMSPEQADKAGEDIDTRSDIYSLGVVLYELLTGRTPFDSQQLGCAGIDDIRRTIREQDPPKPSTRLHALGQPDLTTTARARHTDGHDLIQTIKGDLDWIVMKCLQKDRGRRYQTVNGLAMDLTRYLNHQPVLARPDTRIYLMTRFVRRNRAPVTFAAVLLVALLAGLAGTLVQAGRAKKHAVMADTQRAFALRQLARAEAINDLNTFLLRDVGPQGQSFTVGELLARAERVVRQQTGEPDDTRVELLISIGHQYENLDEHGKARDLFRQAYALSRNLTEPSIRAKAAAALSVAIALAGECERGEALIQEALRELGDQPQFIWHRVFGYLRGSRVARECGREELGVDRVAAARRMAAEAGEHSPLLELTIAMELAEAYRQAGRNREAAATFAAAFEQLTALGRADTDKAGTLLNNWAMALDGLGQLVDAERLYRRAIEVSRADGNDDSVSPMLLNNLARTLDGLHRVTEALRYSDQAYDKAQRAGDEHVLNMCLNVRAGIFRNLGQLEPAGEMLAAFEAKTEQLLPPGHVAFAIVRSQRSMLALARGDLSTALREADQAVVMVEGRPAANDRLAMLLLRRAEVQLKAERYAASREDAARSLALFKDAAEPGTRSCWIGLAQLALAQALQAQNKVGEARMAFTEAGEHLRPSLGDDHPKTRAAARGLAP